MIQTLPSRTLTVSIGRAPREVYEFVSNPENLSKWAKAFCLAARKSENGWTIETPMGPMGLRFAARNDLGVLDHFVSPAPGVEIYVPMRVVRNGGGSEIVFTVFQTPDMSEARLAEDAGMVERDLKSLKSVLEG